MLEIKSVEGPFEANDGRQYKVLRMKEESSVDAQGRKVLSNQPLRTRVVFDKDPSGNVGDPLFYDAEIGCVVEGKIQTVETKPFFVPNENGRDEEDGQKGNYGYKFTGIVFPHETIETVARRNNREPVDVVEEKTPLNAETQQDESKQPDTQDRVNELTENQ